MIDFFIKRPVFTSVCALIILLVGAISIPTLPTAQFPEIAPPQVQVTAVYNGASAEVVEETVTTVLEREINGVEGMRYMTSNSTNDGLSTINATFDLGYDQNIAAVDVQNRVQRAEPQLPQEVQQIGVTILKQNNNILFAGALFADNNEYDPIFLSNYADLYIVDGLKRLEGVADVQIFGERQYAMRLWLDPNKLASRNLVAQDVIDAIEEQNLQVGAGRIGQQPSVKGQQYQLDLRAAGRLEDVAEFEDIVVQSGTDGTLIKLRDVGRVELGAESYDSFLRFRGKDAVGIGIFPLPGSNALTVAENVKAEMAKLTQLFPPGMKYDVGFDTTLYVEESLAEVYKTLLEAIGLVILVIFVFLQDWRTTLIPVVTIPLSLIGTFAFIKVFGFSINSLTLFGIILATGLVVDDAIVVVEQIARMIQDEGMPPRQAASEGMRELSGAVIAMSIVLMAVFVPVAFFPGSTGQIYKQFGLTIAFSIAISTFLALTLAPALSALLLRPKPVIQQGGGGVVGWFSRALAWFFDRFNWGFDKMRQGYLRSLNFLLRIKAIVIVVFIVLLGLTGWLYTRVPTGFLPDEDQGYFITVIQGPEGASLNYTSDLMRRVEADLLKLPETRATFAIGGFDFNGGLVGNKGVIFTSLTPWGDRHGAEHSAEALVGKMMGVYSAIPEATVVATSPPAIQGLGNFSGFSFRLEDQRGNNTIDALTQVAGQFMQRGSQTPGLQAVFTTFAANAPQLQIEVDRDKARALQVPVDEVLNTMQNYLGTRYVNDFNLERRTYRVYVQADSQFRSNPEDIGRLYVRSQAGQDAQGQTTQGQMIPLSNLVKITPITGAQAITHYNLFRAIELNGAQAEGASSGDAIKAMEGLAAELLPPTMGYEWSGLSLDETESGGQAPLIFGLGIIFVFLVLAAQYENYVDPFIILLTVPLAIFGALSAQSFRGLTNDVYCQVGLVMLIGLASKNAILIVEFANQLREKGFSITKAATEAAQERLRPILMTAFAALLGFWPLVVAEGAGALSRQSLGTAIFGGLFASTLLSLFVVPILYIVIGNIRDRLFRRHQPPQQPESQPEPEVASARGR
jgi:HAE1 family hydrophobic/amphiphilic exporter-1